MFIELQEDNLQSILEQNEKTLVMFGAGWCGNCKLLKPKFKKISTENETIPFVYVDADKLPNSRGLVTLTNIPAIVSFKGIENVGQDMGNKIDVVYSVLENIK
jgi:thioredoxin 1